MRRLKCTELKSLPNWGNAQINPNFRMNDRGDLYESKSPEFKSLPSNNISIDEIIQNTQADSDYYNYDKKRSIVKQLIQQNRWDDLAKLRLIDSFASYVEVPKNIVLFKGQGYDINEMRKSSAQLVDLYSRANFENRQRITDYLDTIRDYKTMSQLNIEQWKLERQYNEFAAWLAEQREQKEVTSREQQQLREMEEIAKQEEIELREHEYQSLPVAIKKEIEKKIRSIFEPKLFKPFTGILTEVTKYRDSRKNTYYPSIDAIEQMKKKIKQQKDLSLEKTEKVTNTVLDAINSGWPINKTIQVTEGNLKADLNLFDILMLKGYYDCCANLLKSGSIHDYETDKYSINRVDLSAKLPQILVDYFYSIADREFVSNLYKQKFKSNESFDYYSDKAHNLAKSLQYEDLIKAYANKFPNSSIADAYALIEHYHENQ